MDENIEISVITVCWNSEQTILRTLQSVAAQTFQMIEHIIVDGASSDETMAIVGGFGSEKVRSISEKDEGIYDAMNKGIAMARGRYIHFLNADDVYTSPNSLEAAYDAADEEKLNFFDVNLVDPNGLIIGNYGVGRGNVLWRCCYPQPGWLIAKVNYDAIGAISQEFNIAGDYDYLLRALKEFQFQVNELSLVDMALEGVSNSHWEKSYKQFRDVSVRNGTPYLVATVIYYIKCIKRLLK